MEVDAKRKADTGLLFDKCKYLEAELSILEDMAATKRSCDALCMPIKHEILVRAWLRSNIHMREKERKLAEREPMASKIKELEAKIEDLQDLLLIEQRKNEPYSPIADVEWRLQKDGILPNISGSEAVNAG